MKGPTDCAKLLPDIRIEFAHGKMHEHELEKIMMGFMTGEIDMLVSTTIIETGLDIPNANTLIIEGPSVWDCHSFIR